MASRHMSHIRKWLLRSPPAEWALNQLRELLIGALRQGPVPKHVAFVMDGNRRFAKRHRIETVEGHNLGFEALARILEVCYKSGVTHVTIYAFSIENFKRSKYEVDALMEMAKIKLKQLVEHGDLLDRYGARIRILGQRELIKPDVLEVVDQAVKMTQGNGNCVLNVCFPYTSREEITAAVRGTVEEFSRPIPPVAKSPFKEERIAHTIRSQQQSSTYLEPEAAGSGFGLQSPSSSTTSLSSYDNDNDNDTLSSSVSVSTSTTLHPDDNTEMTSTSTSSEQQQTQSHGDKNTPLKLKYPSPELITPETLDSHMYTAGDPPVDLLIRTSGVSRLSDYLLWQCHEDTQIVFLDVLWPDFDLWSFLPVLWEWQWRTRKCQQLQQQRGENKSKTQTRGSSSLSSSQQQHRPTKENELGSYSTARTTALT
ncbi:Dehydrodolichyl diphosphate synthase complex subunit SPAC4D7.04c [Exophiala dermatitidis]|uniref:Undecaprenyl pyrophosphate synthetase n=1 Tax=Exophiala dermatitidis (strain ATCC 34100 / CBS 525.76 / NIH/UT8656) TaxID=858893 RepID=H6CAN8_EXODN|nr:undecaprenyl pyrophosphate synthetase [Exophiala dermatitidis NIH/UT8656]EHY60835.1 undecaprenyl pyrophosphate synthetase [Exophiala dermatitidis NIH/UT8656]